jgi:hypothetical protein
MTPSKPTTQRRERETVLGCDGIDESVKPDNVQAHRDPNRRGVKVEQRLLVAGRLAPARMRRRSLSRPLGGGFLVPGWVERLLLCWPMGC